MLWILLAIPIYIGLAIYSNGRIATNILWLWGRVQWLVYIPILALTILCLPVILIDILNIAVIKKHYICLRRLILKD